MSREKRKPPRPGPFGLRLSIQERRALVRLAKAKGVPIARLVAAWIEEASPSLRS